MQRSLAAGRAANPMNVSLPRAQREHPIRSRCLSRRTRARPGCEHLRADASAEGLPRREPGGLGQRRQHRADRLGTRPRSRCGPIPRRLAERTRCLRCPPALLRVARVGRRAPPVRRGLGAVALPEGGLAGAVIDAARSPTGILFGTGSARWSRSVIGTPDARVAPRAGEVPSRLCVDRSSRHHRWELLRGGPATRPR